MAALLRVHPVVGILLGGVEFLSCELAVGDRIGAADVARHFPVRDPFHFEGVQPAEISDLLEGHRGIVDEPDGGRLRHQNLVHGGLQKQRRPTLRPGDNIESYSPRRGRMKPGTDDLAAIHIRRRPSTVVTAGPRKSTLSPRCSHSSSPPRPG